LDEASELASRHHLVSVDRTVASMRTLVGGATPTARTRRSLGDVAGALRYGARAMVTTRGRAGMARLVGDGTDSELEKRFGSTLGLRSLMTAMAHGFQPRMAFGFEGEIQFELRPTRTSRRGTDAESDHWWTIEVRGNKAVARHQPAEDPAVTIHTTVADFIRISAGAVNPVTMWIDKRVDIEGDLTLGTRLVELFGGEEPLQIRA
jgi:hypothetical protein